MLDFEVNNQLVEIAEYLHLARTGIVEEWKGLSKRDPEMDTARELPRSSFIDHIPEILDSFEQHLRERAIGSGARVADSENDSTEGHGFSRWQQGFTVVEVVRDWNHLHDVLVATVERGSLEQTGWTGSTRMQAFHLLSQLVRDGILESLAKYEELRQYEAASHVDDLNASITHLNALFQTQSMRMKEVLHDLEGNLGLVSGLQSHASENQKDFGQVHLIQKPIERGLQSCIDLLEDLKLHAKLEAGDVEPDWEELDLGQLIQEQVEPFTLLAPGGDVSFQVKGMPCCSVSTDRLKLGRILNNLLMNAFKYTAKGVVTVDWGVTDGAAFYFVEIRNRGEIVQTNRFLEKMETDTEHLLKEGLEGATPRASVGSMSELECGGTTVFSFPRLLSQSQGIGLSISKRLTDMLGGQIILEKNPDGSGHCAKLIFPLSAV